MKRILAAFTVVGILMAVGVVIAQTPQDAANTSPATTSAPGTPAGTTPSSPSTVDNVQTGTTPSDASSATGTTTGQSSQDMSTSASTTSPDMPKTASPYPLLAFLGLAALGFGAALTIRRRSA